MTHKLFLTPLSFAAATGQRYSATYNAEQIVKSSRNAELDACRVLLSRGVTGLLTTYGVDKPLHPRMTMDIENAAQYTTTEGDKSVLSFTKYSPYEPSNP